MKKFFCAFILMIGGAAVSLAQAEKAVFYQSLAWSPDGKSLAVTAMSDYDEKTDEYRTGILIVSADGQSVRKVSGEAKHAFSPAWSPDGTKIFFGADSADGKESHIFSVGKDGSRLVQLTRTAAQDTAPSVSPDGRKIAFMSRRSGEKYQIYVMNSDGSNLKKLTNEASVSFCNPVFARDGQRIVFYTDKGDRRDQVWIMNADGSKQTLLTGGRGHNIFPSFSPDSKKILFARRDDRDSDKSYADASFLFTMNADGSNQKKLAEINSFYARFSPDGQKLAFVMGKFPSNAIYIARTDGSNIRQLTK